jgi:hypothetical protein
MVDSSDAVDIEYMSSSSSEVLANKAGGNDVLCDNSNAATPLCQISDQDALTITSMYERYPLAVNCLF